MVKVLATAPLGSKVTVNVQLAPFARLEVQEVDSAKLLVAPLVDIVRPVTEAAVLLVSVAVFAADLTPTVSLPKASVDGLNATVPLEVTPVPLASRVWVPAESFTVMVRVFATAPLGSKATVKVQLALLARVEVQLLVSVKLEVAPLVAIVRPVTVTPVVFFSTAVLAADFTPTV